MKRLIRSSPLLLLALLYLSACANTSVPTEDTSAPDRRVILISIDGFAADYLEMYAAPTLSSLASSGVRSSGLTPTFPSKTFPTHYSIVTGEPAGNHGVIANRMYDPEMDDWFWLSKREAVSDGNWYDDAEPIWVTAEKQGVVTAPLFWPGSEAEILGQRPTYWLPYNGALANNDRVDKILEWIDLPGDQQPAFLTLYFSNVDGAGHSSGPDSPEVGQAIARVDSSIARLIEGLESRGLRQTTDIIVTSDHGMTEIDTSRVIVLDDYTDMENITITDTTPVLAVIPSGTTTDSLIADLSGAHPHMSVFRREDLPSRFQYSSHLRIPPVIALADEGWTIVTRERWNPDRMGKGTHGYDNELDSMQGLFIANGPSFREDLTIGRTNVLDIYNLLASLLDVEPTENSGSMSLVEQATR